MWVDSSINDSKIKETLRELALKIEFLEYKGQLLFVAWKKTKWNLLVI